MKTFDSDGVEIAFIDKGEQTPGTLPVLLIHGFASSVEANWTFPGWINLLSSEGFRVVAFDNRGHGQSAKLYRLEDYGSPIMAEDARRLLDHLGIERAHVFGYSMGARISAFLAINHNARVGKIVFGGLGINMVRGMAGTGPIAHALEAPSLDDVTNPTARTFRVFAEQTKSDLKALAACIRSSRAPITTEALGTLHNEILVAAGDGDVIGGDPQQLADLLPKGQSFIIKGRDHMKAVGDRTLKQKVLEFFKS